MVEGGECVQSVVHALSYVCSGGLAHAPGGWISKWDVVHIYPDGLVQNL